MTPLNSPHRAFSPARHANFCFPQTRAAVLWGGVGWGAMTFAFLAHMLDATQLFLAHVLDATQLYKHGCPLDRCLKNISVADYNL